MEHLGHSLTADGSMQQDCKEKRASFIDGAVKIRETFSFAHPSEIIFAVDKYCCSFYGSNLYDLRSESVKRLVAAWRTNVKLSWDVDRSCHNYFLSSVLAQGYRTLLASLLS